MKLTFEGLDWEVRAATPTEDFLIKRMPAIKTLSRQRVYQWDCVKGKGKHLVKVNGKGSVAMTNIVDFTVAQLTMFGALPDKSRSVDMLLRFLKNSTAKSLGSARSILNKRLGVAGKKVPLDRFSDLNEMVSYFIVMHVDYVVLHIQNDQHVIGGYLLIPSRVSFTYDILHFCSIEAFEKAREKEPGIVTRRATFVVPRLNDDNGILRRLGLKPRLPNEDGFTEYYPLPMPDDSDMPEVKYGDEAKEEYDALGGG